MLAGRITGGELAAFVFYASVVASATGALSEIMGDLQRAAGATERMFELLDTAPALVVVGIVMMQSVGELDLQDFPWAATAVLTIIVMPLAFSISEGIGVGLIAATILLTAAAQRADGNLLPLPGSLRGGAGGPFGTVAPNLAQALQKKISDVLLASGLNLPLSSFGLHGFTGNLGGVTPILRPPTMPPPTRSSPRKRSSSRAKFRKTWVWTRWRIHSRKRSRH